MNNRKGKSEFWQHFLHTAPPSVESRKEVNFIAIDEYAEISKETYDNLLKNYPALGASFKRLDNSLLKLRKEIDKDKKIVKLSDYRF